MTQDAPATLPGEGRAGSLVVRGCQPVNSQRVPPCSAREGAARTPRAVPDHHNLIDDQRLIAAECTDPILHDLPNKASARILIETEVNGCVSLFEFISFRHAHRNSQGARHDLA